MKMTNWLNAALVAGVLGMTTIATIATAVPAQADPPAWDHHDSGYRHDGDRRDGVRDWHGDAVVRHDDYVRHDPFVAVHVDPYAHPAPFRGYAVSVQENKNDWRNISYIAGGVAAYGLIEHDPTIAFAGIAGALYSADQYERDRCSEVAIDRARVAYFDRGYFDRDGVHYVRHDTWRDGRHYFYFGR